MGFDQANQLEVIRKMFMAGEESRFNGSDFEPSHIDRDMSRMA